MKPQRRRKSNIQSIEVKVKQQPLQPTGNESLQKGNPYPVASESWKAWEKEVGR